MSWWIAGVLTLWIGSTLAGYSSRQAKSQCYADSTQFSGDRLDNPIFGGGGFIGSLTLKECQAACDVKVDSYARPCVAIEWSDGGNGQSSSTKKSCALAWACDHTKPWGGGSVFMNEDVAGTWKKAYTLFKTTKDWEEAANSCDNTLATWSNEDEWNRIYGLHRRAGSTRTWVGLNDRGWEGHWQFMDKSHYNGMSRSLSWEDDDAYCKRFDSPSTTNWGGNCKKLPQWKSGEPNNHGVSWTNWAGEDCAEINGNGLNDANCDNRLWFVCMTNEEAGGVGDRVSDIDPMPQLPQPNGPVNAPGNYLVFDFASEQQGLVFIALAASNVIWMAVVVYCCCRFKKRKETETYSKVVVHSSEDERLNA